MHRNIDQAVSRVGQGRCRLFLALWPDAEARVALAQAALQADVRSGAAMRAVDLRRYHATLHFLGEYPAPRPDVVAAVERIAGGVHGSAFDWTLDRVRSFHGRRPPRVLVGSVTPDRWRSLWCDWRDALQRELPELPLDTRCLPHVTLGYGHAVLPDVAVTPVRWAVRELVLLESRAGERDYRRLAVWSLSSD